ncbi:hypothetical protein GIB67_022445, partial [Kingdonia uniflora]
MIYIHIRLKIEYNISNKVHRHMLRSHTRMFILKRICSSKTGSNQAKAHNNQSYST